jgi:bifunctional ADP-heptose synthase (sugar kinase/adenylyltransferase)
LIILEMYPELEVCKAHIISRADQAHCHHALLVVALDQDDGARILRRSSRPIKWMTKRTATVTNTMNISKTTLSSE